VNAVVKAVQSAPALTEKTPPKKKRTDGPAGWNTGRPDFKFVADGAGRLRLERTVTLPDAAPEVRKVCGALRVAGLARDPDGGNWCAVVEFVDMDGAQRNG